MKLKLSEKHKKRVTKVQDFTSKNMLFVIMAVIAIILLFSNILSTGEAPGGKPASPETVIEESEQTEPATERGIEKFRFYFVDLVILVGGGAVCLIMILRERRKTKEELK